MIGATLQKHLQVCHTATARTKLPISRSSHERWARRPWILLSTITVCGNVCPIFRSAFIIDFAMPAIRVTTDVLFAQLGSKLAIQTNIHKSGFTQRPRLALVGSEGLAITMTQTPLGDHVLLPGYNHLDVLLADRAQNLGRQELSGISTAKFIAQLGTGIVA